MTFQILSRTGRRRTWILLLTTLVIVISGHFLWPKVRPLVTGKHVIVPRSMCLAFMELERRPFEFETDFYGLRYAGRGEDLVDQFVLHCGAFEKPMLHFLRDYAHSQKRDDLVYLDVGAHHGQHSLFMSQFVSQVHSIEPFPPTLERLDSNIALNDLNNVAVHRVGFGSEDGEIPFHEPPDSNTGVGTFSKDFRRNFKESVRALPIRIDDDYLAAKGVNGVDIVKIDVEGFEKPVLEGLKETLRVNRPLVVMELDVSNTESFGSAKELLAAFPKEYEFLQFEKIPEDILTGEYQLVPYDMSLAEQINLVIYPSERKASMPSSSKQL